MPTLRVLRCIISFYPPTTVAARLTASSPICEDEEVDDESEARLDEMPERASFALALSTPSVRFLVEKACGYAVGDVDLVGLSYHELCEHDVRTWTHRFCHQEDGEQDDDDDQDGEKTPELTALRQRASPFRTVTHAVFDDKEFLYSRWVECSGLRMATALAWWLTRPLTLTEVNHGNSSSALAAASLHLSLHHTYAATPFAGLGIATLVKSLSVVGRQSNLSTIAECTQLRSLTLSDCGSELSSWLSTLPQHAPGLASLRVRDSLLDDVSWVSHMPKLRRVSFAACFSLVDASPLAACTSLLSVDVSFCAGLESVAFIHELPQLRVLNLQETPLQITDDLAEEVSTLRALNVSDCAWLAHADGAHWRATLRHLDVLLASGTPVNAWLPHVCAVNVLNLSYCAGLTEIAPLGTCLSLRVLTLTGCSNIESIEPVLLGCPALEVLDMANCASIAALFHGDRPPPVSLSVRLRELYARHSGLCDVRHVQALRQLAVLDVTGCSGIEDLSMLAGMPRLEKVWAAQTSVTNTDWTASCPRLREFIWDGEE